jgi:hypothetical protein
VRSAASKHESFKTSVLINLLKLLNIKFHENLFSGSRVTYGQRDMVELMSAFLQLLVVKTLKRHEAVEFSIFCSDWSIPSVNETHRHSRPEDGDIMFLRNVGVYRWVYTAPKPCTSSFWEYLVNEIQQWNEMGEIITTLSVCLRASNKKVYLINKSHFLFFT